jgi:hypothetical protein
MEKMPNFFIVGTPKAGTTSLYYYLDEHPEIYMSPIKETNYFSQKDIKAQGLYYNEEHINTPEDYAAQFRDVANEKAIGEASVSYLFYPDVAERIKEFNPEAKIIMVLRNPLDRGFSHYLMDKRLGFIKSSLEDIVYDEGKTPALELFYQQYISLGCYYAQVKRYLDAFGSNQVKVFFYEDIIKNIDGTVKEIYSFLGVDNAYNAAVDQKHNVFLAPKNSFIEKLYALKSFRTMAKKLLGENVRKKVKNIFFIKEKKPVLSSALKAKMNELFREDILKTAELLNKDLSKWLA